jgi:predicted transposase YbfD/YdcC
MSAKLTTLFSELEDPRSPSKTQHQLNDILLIGIIAVLCGAETWNNVEEYGRAKEDFLGKFLDLPNGIPSHDTFNRVFSSIDPEQFERGFIKWVEALVTITDGEVIAIDGKTIRGAKSRAKKSPFHIVSAWASDNNVVLGQVMTDKKSNEITAIPRLLEILALEGTTITIDAMGCQQEIAFLIREKKANYILAVKENQKFLHQDILDEFRFAKDVETVTSIDAGHGRIETRICTIISTFSHLQNLEKWRGLQSIVKVESIREFKNSDRPTEKAARYYISSLKATAEVFQKAIRSHWGIENKLHWVLDVAFGEDASRKRIGYAAQNFATLNKIALNLLKKDKSSKVGIKGRRLKAAWDNQYLMKVLNI